MLGPLHAKVEVRSCPIENAEKFFAMARGKASKRKQTDPTTSSPKADDQVDDNEGSGDEEVEQTQEGAGDGDAGIQKEDLSNPPPKRQAASDAEAAFLRTPPKSLKPRILLPSLLPQQAQAKLHLKHVC